MPKHLVHNDGDTRISRKYAARPTYIKSENIKVWLEYYFIQESFSPSWPTLFRVAYNHREANEPYDKTDLAGNWIVNSMHTKEELFLGEL